MIDRVEIELAKDFMSCHIYFFLGLECLFELELEFIFMQFFLLIKLSCTHKI